METIVNLHDFYSLNLWKILLGGLGWSSHTVKYLGISKLPSLFKLSVCFIREPASRLPVGIMGLVRPSVAYMASGESQQRNERGGAQFVELFCSLLTVRFARWSFVFRPCRIFFRPRLEPFRKLVHLPCVQPFKWIPKERSVFACRDHIFDGAFLF